MGPSTTTTWYVVMDISGLFSWFVSSNEHSFQFSCSFMVEPILAGRAHLSWQHGTMMRLPLMNTVIQNYIISINGLIVQYNGGNHGLYQVWRGSLNSATWGTCTGRWGWARRRCCGATARLRRSAGTWRYTKGMSLIQTWPNLNELYIDHWQYLVV